VSLSSGTNPGTVTLEAFILSSDSLTTLISATKSNIVIHAGPPNSVELTIGDIDSGIDLGGGVWQIECAAIVHDEWGNPVDHFTAVWFSLVDLDSLNTQPSWATIGAEAYVGNENAVGDSTSGVAYTYLNYEGEHTNDSLMIQVEIAGLTDQAIVTMPPQFVEIQVVATPNHVDWNAQTNNLPHQYSLITATVLDGQNNLINGQRVIVTSTYGYPVVTNGSTTASYEGVTVNGIMEKYVVFFKYECPPPPGTGDPGERPVTVVVADPVTGVSGETDIVLRRYID